jgi:sigma-B regulation protein RsbU (phosphoserine phosphatase)
MGPLLEAEYGRRMIQIEEGDALVLYSDGVVERRNVADDDEFGLERFKDELRGAIGNGLDAAQTCDHILDQLREFGGGAPWADDVTILVIRRLQG